MPYVRVELVDGEACDLARFAKEKGLTMEEAAHKLLRMGIFILRQSEQVDTSTSPN